MLSASVILCAFGLQEFSKTNIVQDQDQKVQTKLLLAPGTTAPDFTVEKWGGGNVKLSDYKGKYVVLDFFSTSAPQTIDTLNRTEKVYKLAKEQGLALVEVSTWDDRSNFETWAKTNEANYTLTFGYDPTAKDDAANVAKKLYKVSDLPTTYIIDKDGKVVTSFVGYKEDDTRLVDELKKLGFKIDQN